MLVVAGDPLARGGLAAMLFNQPGYAVVGQVSGETDLSADLEVLKPDVVVWDLGWDPPSALENLEAMGGDSTPVLALLPDGSHAAEAWHAGARGLLMRHADSASLTAALTALAQGLVALDPEVGSVIGTPRDRAPVEPVESLTPRELEVLQLLAEGLPNKEIAHRLGVSEHTVKFHVNAIMDKLDARSRTEAVVRATRLGLILL